MSVEYIAIINIFIRAVKSMH